MFKRRMRPLVRYLHPEPLEDPIRVLAPGDGNGCRGYSILEDQVPSDDPRDQLAHGGVGICVGASGKRNHGGKFGVTETGECAAESGNDEGENDGWTRAVGDCRGRPDKKARANNRPDTERDKIPRSERTLETVL